MGDNLQFYKMTFCDLFRYCLVRIQNKCSDKSFYLSPHGLEFKPYFARKYGFRVVNNGVTSLVTENDVSQKGHTGRNKNFDVC